MHIVLTEHTPAGIYPGITSYVCFGEYAQKFSSPRFVVWLGTHGMNYETRKNAVASFCRNASPLHLALLDHTEVFLPAR